MNFITWRLPFAKCFRAALCGLAFSLVLALPSQAQGVGTNVVDLKRETFEGMNWEAGGNKMGQQGVAGTLQGLGAGDAFVAYKFEGRYDILEAWIGYLKPVAKGRSCRFEVIADGQSIYTSEIINSATEPTKVRIPVKGKNMVLLYIKPEHYGATLGAAWGTPMVFTGVRPEDFPQPLTVEINGKSTQVSQPGGTLPKELGVPIPVSEGTYEYRVRVQANSKTNQVKIHVEKASP